MLRRIRRFLQFRSADAEVQRAVNDTTRYVRDEVNAIAADLEPQLQPLQFDTVFRGDVTIPAGKVGYLPDGTTIDGTITVDGELRILP